MPLSLSVVTVVRNDLEGLKVTAESILSQDFGEYEWIIVDGCSTDGSYEYAKELASHTSVKVEQIPARGIYNAMNHGAGNSSTPWLWFVNAGDIFLDETVLSAIGKIAKQKKSASIIATPVAYLTPSQTFYSISIPRIVEEKSKRFALFHHQGSIMRKAIFLEAGGFDENFDFAADGKLLDSMVFISESVIVPLVTVGFEMGGASSRNFRRSLKEIRKYRQEILPTNKVVIYQLKEFLRNLILKGSSNTKISYLFSRYLNSRERSVKRKARLLGLKVVDRKTKPA